MPAVNWKADMAPYTTTVPSLRVACMPAAPAAGWCETADACWAASRLAVSPLRRGTRLHQLLGDVSAHTLERGIRALATCKKGSRTLVILLAAQRAS